MLRRKVEITVTEELVKMSIIKWLSSSGWGHFRFGASHQHGPDIYARNQRYSRPFIIETKGESESKSAKSIAENNFVYSLGQIITRMKTGASRYYYGIGLPESSARIAIRRLPWQAAKKLLLYVFSVDKAGNVEQYSWKELKAAQQ